MNEDRASFQALSVAVPQKSSSPLLELFASDARSARNSCENELVFIAQRVGQRANQIEQPVAAGLDMSAVLNILVGPVVFSRGVVAPVEERVKCFEDMRFVLFR